MMHDIMYDMMHDMYDMMHDIVYDMMHDMSRTYVTGEAFRVPVSAESLNPAISRLYGEVTAGALRLEQPLPV